MKRIAVPAVICTALAVMFLAYSKQSFDGVARAIDVCLNVAVPSLFPMLFVTSYIAESGVAQTIGNKLAPVFERVFSLPGEAASVFVMCVLGGYPAGASLCTALYEKGAISLPSAQWLTKVCVCAGPAFLISTVGGVYYGSTRAGIILLAAQILSLVIIALFVPKPAADFFHRICEQRPIRDNAFVTSAIRASRSMMNVCIYIILFGAFMAVLEASGLMRWLIYSASELGVPEVIIQGLLYSAAEVTSGCAYAAKAGFAVTGFAIGFGGLSVHFQIFAIAEKIKISRLRFIAVRLIQGVICSGAAVLTDTLWKTDEAVTVAAIRHAWSFPDVSGSVLLLIMCAMFVLCAPQINHQSSRP